MTDTTSKLAPADGRNAALLAARLRVLGIQSAGLPAHVLAHLREIVKTEAAKIQVEVDAELAAVNKRASERLSRRIASRLTYKTVGRSFIRMRAGAEKPDRVSPRSTSASVAGGAS